MRQSKPFRLKPVLSPLSKSLLSWYMYYSNVECEVTAAAVGNSTLVVNCFCIQKCDGQHLKFVNLKRSPCRWCKMQLENSCRPILDIATLDMQFSCNFISTYSMQWDWKLTMWFDKFWISIVGRFVKFLQPVWKLC